MLTNGITKAIGTPTLEVSALVGTLGDGPSDAVAVAL